MSDKAVKYNSGKPEWSILFDKLKDPLEEVVRVLEFGAKKYERDNWCKPLPHDNFYRDAAFRHMLDMEVFDEETGESHMAHAICCLLMHRWHQRESAKQSEQSPTTSQSPTTPQSIKPPPPKKKADACINCTYNLGPSCGKGKTMGNIMCSYANYIPSSGIMRKKCPGCGNHDIIRKPPLKDGVGVGYYECRTCSTVYSLMHDFGTDEPRLNKCCPKCRNYAVRSVASGKKFRCLSCGCTFPLGTSFVDLDVIEVVD